MYVHVLELSVSDRREAALLELSQKRDDFADLAPILWHSFGTITALLQEIVAIYPLLSPPRLTPGQYSVHQNRAEPSEWLCPCSR